MKYLKGFFRSLLIGGICFLFYFMGYTRSEIIHNDIFLFIVLFIIITLDGIYIDTIKGKGKK